jgi:hypothetical protein
LAHNTGLAAFRRRLKASAQKARTELHAQARHVAEALAEGTRERMPVDAGVARDAIEVRKATHEFIVQYDTASIRGHATNAFFYPAVIEYGSYKLHREPVRPMGRAAEDQAVDLAGAAAQAIGRVIASCLGVS